MTLSDQPNIPHAALLHEAVACAPDAIQTTLETGRRLAIAKSAFVLATYQQSPEVAEFCMQYIPNGDSTFLSLVNVGAISRNEADTVKALSYFEEFHPQRGMNYDRAKTLFRGFTAFVRSDLLRKAIVPIAGQNYLQNEGINYAKVIAQITPEGTSYIPWAAENNVKDRHINMAALDIYDTTGDPALLPIAASREYSLLKGSEQWYGVSTVRMIRLQKIYAGYLANNDPEGAERFARQAAVAYEQRVKSVRSQESSAFYVEHLSLDCYDRIKDLNEPQHEPQPVQKVLIPIAEALSMTSPTRQEQTFAETYNTLATEVLQSRKNMPVVPVPEGAYIPFVSKRSMAKKRRWFSRR